MSVRRRPATDCPDQLSPEARARIVAWAKAEEPWALRRLRELWPKCRDWHLSNGVLRADWEATFRNWVRQQRTMEGREKPQETGRRGNEPTDLGEEIQGALRLIAGGKDE